MDFSALHEHLDGGLRPNTIIEIATSKNISVPSRNEESLRKWFFENISSEKKQVFKKFEMTISVMQDIESIERVTYEAIDAELDAVATNDDKLNMIIKYFERRQEDEDTKKDKK